MHDNDKECDRLYLTQFSFTPCKNVVQAEPCSSPSVVYAQERGNEGGLDSSCLILGSTWTLGLSAQEKGQHGTEDGQGGTEL